MKILTIHYYLKINKLAYEFYAFAKVVEKGFSVDFNNQTWGHNLLKVLVFMGTNNENT